MNDIKSLPIWVVWRKEKVNRPGSENQLNERFTKVPFQINGQHASSVDPTHWVTFEQAAAAAPNFSGIGFTISKHHPLLCIDLDHVLNTEG
jgi:primase-polymerase (primpol)-like protein